MSDTYFEILRPGTNTTIQDKGRSHLYHIGITISGAMDQRIFILSNALVNNDLNEGALEFAYQGPLLKLKNLQVSKLSYLAIEQLRKVASANFIEGDYATLVECIYHSQQAI